MIPRRDTAIGRHGGRLETETGYARSTRPRRRGRVRMKDELATILDAMLAAQAELAAYLNSADPDAELTLAKLVGILERREVVRATQLLRPARRPSAVSELAEAS